MASAPASSTGFLPTYGKNGPSAHWRKWRAYPPCKLGEYTYDAERDYLESHLLAWADEHKDDELRLQILKKKMRHARDVIELAKEYRRRGMSKEIIPLLRKAHKEFDRDRAITDAH